MFTNRSLRAAALALSLSLSGAALVAAVSLPRPALAADVSSDKMPASYAALMTMKPMDVMHMMDGDKKGHVTKEQFMKFHEAMFDKMDKDKDGQLSREEWLGKIHSSP